MLLERETASEKRTVRSVLDRVKADQRSSLSAPEAKQVADAYGLPVPQEGLATSADEAVKLAEQIGFPVVMKIVYRRSCIKRKPAACWSASRMPPPCGRLRTDRRPTPGSTTPRPRFRACKCSRCCLRARRK